MTSHGTINVSLSPKGNGNGQPVATASTNSPKGQCLCSPTTHNGSFRCRFHRSLSSTWRMKRSKSMPANSTAAATTSISPKSVEST
ncbi:hypothetical protein BVC80_9069g38 [Macleaya cordata]|uniref:Uncharacterized protein n=1 Tax=Macleaya cordata TaxID=56857 RepID=A0A200PNZ0_MACCD|nr:hypothetical protein BVC80_9069g38 [Macleaya cordata]